LLVPLNEIGSPAYPIETITKHARRKLITILLFIDDHLTCPMLEEGKSGTLVR
jgi:hypothetical protein